VQKVIIDFDTTLMTDKLWWFPVAMKIKIILINDGKEREGVTEEKKIKNM